MPETDYLKQILAFNGNVEEIIAKTKLEFYDKLPETISENITYNEFLKYFKTGSLRFTKKMESGHDKLSISKLKSDIKKKALNKIRDKKEEAETEEEFELKVHDLSTVQLNPNDFVPFKTNKGIDIIFSKKGGVMPGTSYVLIGNPGAGKTTNANQILSDIRKNNPDADVMSFSSEMKEIDVHEELSKNSWMKNVPHILFEDYEKAKYLDLVKNVFLHGYDVLVFDSFQNTIERLKSVTSYSSNELANLLMELIETATKGETKTGKKTAVLIIQQVTKGGEFAGKNSLKHDTTGMLHFNHNKETGERSCVFSKNRRCGDYQYKELFYDMDENSEIQYDIKRFNEDRQAEAVMSQNKKEMDKQKEAFENIFSKNKNSDLNNFNFGSENNTPTNVFQEQDTEQSYIDFEEEDNI